jgi:hypothetical protein
MRIRNRLLITFAAGCAGLAGPATYGGVPVCPWDCEAVPDGRVGVTDFLAMLAQWGQAGTPCDFNGGGVSVTDFLEMLAHWGPCPVLVPAGIDCWDTPCGETKMSFCLVPIPADFFDAGSQPFDGEVRLQGATGSQDTIVQRRQDALFDDIPQVRAVEIEIIQLDLVSCQPIDVQCGGGDCQWDVEVELSPTPAPIGQMQIIREHPNGGVFQSDLFVQPKFTFTRVGQPSQVRVLDTGQAGFPPDRLFSLGPIPWVHFLDPKLPIEPCGVNFVPGVESQPGDPPAQCCRPVCHSGATADHCIVVGVDCSRCPTGACCLPDDGTCIMTLDESDCVDNFGGDYKGDGTTCFDSDGDGIPDVQETNDCCGPTDPCHTGTSPTNPDTDGDGCLDGEDPDPCDENIGC